MSEICRFIPSSSFVATLDVYAGEVGKPISKYLFGKFTEHLGRNIYHGMWAQILENPSFEPPCFFADKKAILEERLRVIESLFPKIKILESFQTGVAYGWARYGEGNVVYSLIPDAIGSGSWTSQKIEAFSIETDAVGIQQLIFLPLHREEEYELSLWAKGNIKKIKITIEAYESKDLLAEEIEDIKATWNKHFKKIRISKQGIERGAPLVFSISFNETGSVILDHCFLFPADNIEGFDPEIIKLTKEANVTILRYPGGNFASQYHWKDGIGPIEDRPIRLNRAWNIAEYNYVGTDEFMKFCSLVGAEPLICINAGDGTPEEAAAWVGYCNGDLNTTYGKLRAENGYPEPYNVKYWEIGNELYGRWQVGYCSAEEYAERYERFYKAMSKIDSDIKFIANGYDLDWDKVLVQRKGDILRSLSIHLLVGSGILKENVQIDEVYYGLIAYTYWLRGYLEKIRDEMSKKVKNPKIAITELQIHTRDPTLPNNKTLTEALFYSGVVNTSICLGGFVELITHSALVNHGGGLNKEREIVYADPVYYAQKIYATQPGRLPVKLKIETPMFNTREIPSIHTSELGRLPAVENVPFLDAIALLSEDKEILSIIISNRHAYKSIQAKIYLHDFKPQELVKTEILNGPSYMSRNTWEKPDLVKTIEDYMTIDGEELVYSFPAHSIVNFIFKRVI